LIGFSLTPGQTELAAEVKDIADRHIIPRALEMDRRGDDSFDWSLVELLAAHNLLAPHIPAEYGGRGLGFLDLALIIEEISRGCAGLAACMAGELHATIPIIFGGSKKQKKRFLPPLVNKQPALAAFALTEPKGGSDVKQLTTSVSNQSNETFVNGTKDYIVNGAVSSFVNACASSETDRSRSSFRFVLVPGEQVKVARIRNKMGIKYCNTAQLHFDNCRVPKENLIGTDGSGYLLLSQTLDCGRALIGAIEVGIARAAYEMVLDFAQHRTQFGRPIFYHQGVSFPLVEMATLIDAARLMVWRACWAIDQGEDFSKASSMARYYASKVAQQVTSEAINITGAAGYTSDNLLNVYFRDSKVGSIVGGTDNVQKMVISSML